MCNAGSAVLALTAVSTIFGVKGQIDQGKAANNQAQYSAVISRKNAIAAERAAQDAILRGQRDELTTRLDYKQIKGKQRAAFAANGVIVDEGSALDVVLDTVAIGEFDALTVRNNAAKEAFNYRQQGEEFSSQAQMQIEAGKDAKKAGYIGAASSFLGGAATVADKWYTYKSLDSNWNMIK